MSEGDQAFLGEFKDGGDLSKIEESLARAAKFSGRAATWYLEIVRAEKEAEALQIPRLTAIIIIGDSSSSRIENKLLYAPEFRSWAGKNLVLCLIRVEPKTSRMAMTDEMTGNRRVAKLYGVRTRPALMLNVAGDSMGLSVPLKKIETVDDLIREIQNVLDAPSKSKAYIESKDAPK